MIQLLAECVGYTGGSTSDLQKLRRKGSNIAGLGTISTKTVVLVPVCVPFQLRSVAQVPKTIAVRARSRDKVSRGAKDSG